MKINNPNQSYGIKKDGTRIKLFLDDDLALNASNLNLVKLVVLDKSIKYLYCNYNSLTSLYVSNLLNLEILSCYNNSLTSLDVLNLKHLKM